MRTSKLEFMPVWAWAISVLVYVHGYLAVPSKGISIGWFHAFSYSPKTKNRMIKKFLTMRRSVLIGLCTIFCMLITQNSYSESYLLSVGESVTITQSAYGGGYIDNVGLADYLDGHLSFTKNYDGSAKITVKSYFDYPATVKLVFIERYTYMGRTRTATYYRDVTINCKYVAPQPTVKPTKVSLPERIRVSIDEGRVPVTAILEPYGATPTSVSWTKDDGTGLFVLDNSESVTCHIRGNSTGIGKLWVHIGDFSEWYYNDDLSAKAIIEVYDPQFPFPAGVLLPSSYEISKGGHVTLVPVLSPEGTSSSFTWTSSNKNVATVEYGKVTGVSEGKTTITVKTANEQVATTEITVVSSNGKDDEEGSDPNNPGYIDGHEYVDLGLSVKWATCNVGASSPENTGSKFAWGETSEKTEYTWANYLNGGNQNIGSDIKGTKYDAAYVNWGSKWRMPSEMEVKELISKCTCKSLTINEVNGYQITGPNGNSIFIPGDGSIWTSSISSNDEDRARHFYIHLIYNSMGIESQFRFKGLFVRAVTEASGSGSTQKLVLSATPSGGLVSAGSTVTLNVKADGSTVSGCDIYYTTNGTTPSRNNGTKYSSGITINNDCTLKAIAYKSGYEDSDVLAATYTIKENPKPKLVLTASPSGGQVSAGTTVTLTVKADGSTVYGCDIYYTTNGSTPSKSNGTKYSSGITINSACTLKAIAYKSGYEDSNVLIEYYTIRKEVISNATCAEILAGEDGITYRVTGTVKSIENTIYGNWYLEDSTGEIYIYGTRDRNGNTGKNNSIEDWGIKEGYLMTVEGPRKTYKGKVELVDVVVIDCHEKSGEGTLESPFNSASANAIGLALGEGNTSEESYYIKGKVSRIKEEYTAQYGNGTFYISDDGTQNNEFYVYRAFYIGNKKFTSYDNELMEGDEVVIYGIITNYKGVPETKQYEAYLYSLNGMTETEESKGFGSLENPFNALEALDEAKKLSLGETSSNSFYVKGIISDIKTPYSEKYHRSIFYISDDGTTNNQFLAYGTYYLENKEWIEGYPQIAIGDNVTLYGKMCNYNGTYEMADKQNYIYSHNGNTKAQYVPKTMYVVTSNTGNASFYDSRSAYSLPSGLLAQVIINASNSKLTYKTIADGSVSGVVPKGTAVMLVSDTKQAGTYTLTSSESTATYTGTNLLRGSDEATMTTGDGYHYKLSYGHSGTGWSDVFGWYWGANDGAPFQIEGHKAWMVVPKTNGTRAMGYSIDGDALYLDDNNHEQITNNRYYDLQGRRVSQPMKKGVYIKDGKKVVK